MKSCKTHTQLTNSLRLVTLFYSRYQNHPYVTYYTNKLNHKYFKYEKHIVSPAP